MADQTEKKSAKNKKPKVPKVSCIDQVGGIFCNVCNSTLENKKNFDTHYKSHQDSNIVYTCVICFKNISNYDSFRNHCYIHHVLKARLECHMCGKAYSKVPALKEHIKNSHWKVFTCPAPCNQTFNTLEALQEHAISHMIKSTYRCQTCNTNVDDQQACEKHIDSHIEYNYSCPICDQTLTNKLLAPQHIHKHFPDEVPEELAILNETQEPTHISGSPVQVSCNVCKNRFTNKSDYEDHYKSQHGENVIYNCVVCEKSFDVYSMLSNHTYNHFIKDRFKCDSCEKSFPRLALLVLHVEAIHANGTRSQKPFTCVQCRQGFGAGKSLKAHLMHVHGAPYQICAEDSCGKMFDSPEAFIVHQIVHKQDSGQRCNKCGLLFKNSRACHNHLSVHAKTKFTCPVCGKKYSDKYLAVRHVRQHYQTVFHTCEHCGKMYPLRSRLLEHLKVHQRELFSCTYCEKKFPSEKRFREHMNVHTGNTPYKCTLCEKSFAAVSNVRKHLKTVHNIISVSVEALLRGNRSEEGSASSEQKPSEQLQLSVSVADSAGDEFDDPALMEFKQDVSRLLQNDDIFADDELQSCYDSMISEPPPKPEDVYQYRYNINNNNINNTMLTESYNIDTEMQYTTPGMQDEYAITENTFDRLTATSRDLYNDHKSRIWQRVL